MNKKEIQEPKKRELPEIKIYINENINYFPPSWGNMVSPRYSALRKQPLD